MSDGLPPLLIVDDEKNMRLSLETVMRDENYESCPVASAEEGLELVRRREFFLVISDCRLEGMSGYEFLREVRKIRPDLPVLMITAYATPRLAVESIREGAIDYLAKPFEPEELLHAVSRCAERYRLIRENRKLRQGPDGHPDRILGESESIRALRQFIGTVAPTEATVLILGESGTGKELIAGAICSLSKRRDRNYVRINCAAIPEQLLESELFGHEKGAFTGAVRSKAGRVEDADGGTVFLDEIGDMSRPLQAKLLRFLEDGSFTRVGGNREKRVDVRLIAATNRDIVGAIREGVFREDLFHRLNVVQCTPPPLRVRTGDIRILAEHFLRQFCESTGKTLEGFSEDALRMLGRHPWPGNVRELRNAVERAVILETGKVVRTESLPDFRLEVRLYEPPPGTSLETRLDDFERNCILHALDRCHYDAGRTAENLGIPPEELEGRMQRLEIPRHAPRT